MRDAARPEGIEREGEEYWSIGVLKYF